MVINASLSKFDESMVKMFIFFIYVRGLKNNREFFAVWVRKRERSRRDERALKLIKL